MQVLALSKFVAMGLTGFVAGAGAILALLLVNPFVTTVRLAPAITATDDTGRILETFSITIPDDLVAVTHNGNNIIDPRPSGIPLLDEPGVRSALLLIAKIRNDSGTVVGFATESEAVDPLSNPLLGRMRMNTDWTILLPGRGTIFVTQIEDAGTVGKRILPTVMLGGEWNGRADFISTAGPDSNGRGVIVGGTREFQGVSGSFVEVSHMTHMSRAKGGIGTVQLQLAYRRPAAYTMPAQPN